MTAARRTSPPPVKLVREENVTLDGHRHRLTPGAEATILLPTRKDGLRCVFRYADADGNLTFVDPRNGGLRTVRPEAVKTVHYKQKIERKPR